VLEGACLHLRFPMAVEAEVLGHGKPEEDPSVLRHMDDSLADARVGGKPREVLAV
jgi:hypothetical protein